MASTTAQCPWCSATFEGYGENRREAREDAVFRASDHAWSCASNPRNQKEED